jgi:hypothetical protein
MFTATEPSRLVRSLGWSLLLLNHFEGIIFSNRSELTPPYLSIAPLLLPLIILRYLRNHERLPSETASPSEQDPDVRLVFPTAYNRMGILSNTLLHL